MSYIPRKGLKDWLAEKNKPKGASALNLEFLRELRECHEVMKDIKVATLFVGKEMGIQNVLTMFQSAVKQDDLIESTMRQLKKYKVEPDWKRTFELDIQGIHRRIDWVKKITEENIRLTHAYPYYKAVGFKNLYRLREDRNLEATEAAWKADMEAWNAKHKAEVEKHLADIAEEAERVAEYDRRRREKIQAEKDARKAAKKAEREYLKELAENRKKNLREEREANRVYEYWCR